jgi:hypothetical protein
MNPQGAQDVGSQFFSKAEPSTKWVNFVETKECCVEEGVTT